MFQDAMPRWRAISDQFAPLRRRVRASEIWFLFLAIGVGAVAGLSAVLQGIIARAMQRFFFDLPAGMRLSSAPSLSLIQLLALPLGGLVLGGLIVLFRRQGNATPVDVVEANALHGGRLSIRDTITVSLQTLVSNGFGASVGLEAAYAQVGGGVGSAVGRRAGLRRADVRTLLGAGAGAAIGAAFGAPLTGAFYAFEIVIGVYTPSALAPVAAATLAGAVTARALGSTPYLIAVASSHAIHTVDYLLYAVLGLICAGLGIGLMRLVALFEAGAKRIPVPDWLRPALGGIAVAGLASVSPQVLSAGHGALHANLGETSLAVQLLIGLFLLKALASAVSLGFGFRGGLFFASLFLGSLLGNIYAQLLAHLGTLFTLGNSDAALVGMAALAVAVVGGPMTMSLLVLEATHDFALTATVITAALIASVTVREGFGYSFSTWRLHLRGETVRSARDIGWVRALTADKMMRRDVMRADADMSVSAFRAKFPLGSTSRVVLVDGSGNYAGIVPTAIPHAASVSPTTSVRRLALHPSGPVLRSIMNIAQVMYILDEAQADELAVVGSGGEPLGVLTEKYVRRRYSDELEKIQRDLFRE